MSDITLDQLFEKKHDLESEILHDIYEKVIRFQNETEVGVAEIIIGMYDVTCHGDTFRRSNPQTVNVRLRLPED